MSDLHDWVIPSGNTTSWKCLKCDMRVLSHGRPNEEGCSERYYPNDTRRTNHRPESYSTKGPAVVSEKPKLSVEQVHAELRTAWAEYQRLPTTACHIRIDELLTRLPTLDVVEECTLASVHIHGGAATWNDLQSQGLNMPERRREVSAAIRRYLELRGLPADPELEGK